LPGSDGWNLIADVPLSVLKITEVFLVIEPVFPEIPTLKTFGSLVSDGLEPADKNLPVHLGLGL
jgi:hypothetical protein